MMQKDEQQMILTYLQKIIPAQHHLYAILDAAQDERIFPALADYGCEYLCLYREHRLAPELAQAAPYLVTIDTQSSFARWLIKNGWKNNWGIYALSKKEIFDVISHFRKFVLVQDEEGNTLYFRYYDPRVLRVYLPTCTDSELKSIFGPIQIFLTPGEDLQSTIEYKRQTSGLTQSIHHHNN